jgi:hypothetical protein
MTAAGTLASRILITDLSMLCLRDLGIGQGAKESRRISINDLFPKKNKELLIEVQLVT